jgi:hypothetical protein
MNKDVHILDRKISSLRFRLARPGEDYRRPAVLEITAKRKAPREHSTRLILQPVRIDTTRIDATK